MGAVALGLLGLACGLPGTHPFVFGPLLASSAVALLVSPAPWSWAVEIRRRPSRVRLGSIMVDSLTEAAVATRVRDGWRTGSGGSIVTLNVDIARQAATDPECADLIRRSSLVVADGMPVVWAGRLAGAEMPERVTGSSLVHTLSAAAAVDGRSVFLLGGADGVPEAAATQLQQECAGLKVAGAYSPPFGFDTTVDGMREVVERVRAAGPDLVLVGLGCPKQERVIAELRPVLPAAWYIGCGAGIPMAAGLFKRAPQWMQRSGLEWLFRLMLEPGRLAGRYLRRGLPHALALLGRAARTRFASLLPVRTEASDRASNPDPGEPAQPGYVCFSAQDWWYHNRAHSDFQLMRRVAERRRVLVVNSIGMRMPTPGRSSKSGRRIVRKLRSIAKLVRRPLPALPQFFVMSPVPLPFYSSPLLRRVNAVLVRAQVRVVCAALRLRAPVLVTTLPTAWDVIEPMERRTVIFNRSDRHSAFPESDTEVIEGMEQQLLRGADHVLYVSRALMGEESPLAGDRGYFLDHGVDLEHFRTASEITPAAELADLHGPVIGFFGALDDFVVDFDLLERVAAEFPEATLLLVGDSAHSMERLTRYPNVRWLGFQPYSQIPALGSRFDVALMPWVDSSWIHSSNPIKLKEYLALGLPVVTTEFAEAEHYRDWVRIASSHDEFIAKVRLTLADGGLGTREQRRQAVAGASWSRRAEQLITLAEGR